VTITVSDLPAHGGTSAHVVRYCSLLAASAALLFVAPAANTVAQDAAASYGVPGSRGSATGALAVTSREIGYSEFVDLVDQGKVAAVVVSGERIRGELKSGSSFVTVSPATDNHAMIETLIRNNVKVSGEHRGGALVPTELLSYALPVLLLIGVGLYFMQPKHGDAGGEGAAQFRKSRAREISPGEIRITFSDVAGVDEAKQEVAELVDFLKDSDKFRRLGGKIPRGVLMVGSPGTGKTLLAKAIAGEAGVPCFTVSGADFVEMFVGVGASRVRDLFDRAEQHAPCVVFIDEIDAVGRHRSTGAGGAHDEREQTLNQLLVRMDGFEDSKGVIVIAATNRPDVLDPALLRAGRFDRQIEVPLPDVRGREQILRVHTRAVPLAGDVDLATIARAVPGFSGADLANLVNEAALFAAHFNESRVGQQDFDRAMDKIVLGTERRSMLMSVQDKKLTAYHEAGHAIVGLSVPDHDPVYKVSIMPRGRALGVTVYLPEADRLSHTKEALDSRICALFGGRVAEALIFGADRITSGASNDIRCATEIARAMVTQHGMSDTLGPLAYRDDDEQSFLDGRAARIKRVSEGTARAIDVAVREVIDRNYARASQILEAHQEDLHLMAEALIRHETIDRGQINAIMQRRDRGLPASSKDEDEPILASEANLAAGVPQLGGDASARLAAPCEAGATTVARERI
jgi:cell division protease FtsH